MGKFKAMLCFLSLLSSSYAFGAGELIENHNCPELKSDGLRSIVVPLDHSGVHSSKSFRYQYQFVNNTISEENAKTIVFLTGGPGAGQMGNYTELFFQKVRKLGFDLLLIDPRGVACNSILEVEVPDTVITSEQTAKDIIEVIKFEELNDYLIWGHSYGTMLGTILTSLINKNIEVSQPKLLVLEGVLSKNLVSGAEYLQNYADSIQFKVSKILPNFEEVFFSGKKSLPFGLPEEYWLNLMEVLPAVGVKTFTEFYPEFIQLLEEYPESLKNDELREHFIEDFNSGLTAPVSVNNDFKRYGRYSLKGYNDEKVGYSIMCKEISPTDVANSTLLYSGNQMIVLTDDTNDKCDKFEFNKIPYDSRSYLLDTKTLYFQGSIDGPTPLEYARYHYKHNTAEKVFVEVFGGGHSPFFDTLSDCTSSIWSQIKKGSTDFKGILSDKGHCLVQDAE